MAKILYIGNRIDNPTNGGDMIDYRNQTLLRKFSGDQLIFVEPDFKSRNIASKLTLGLTSVTKELIKTAFSNNDIHCVFVSQSY